ncbi:alkaline phosphatase [Auraticoccus sp. F435]|uniref:Alkaline phosphatase n=1 Tax=Auraticoccus cholistanensis TaxID=2656650 RepID=A0A6A9UY18_9ACTN|nr:alkaline phosphatase D family protein [Auraticoccus cholistanensis]MVA76705.1 alkaline phosphatase [Auraticoccus cholistanensis]
MELTPSRRTLLTAGLVGTAAAATPLIAPTAALASPVPQTDPFTLGVASGDPWPESVILWTRLATDPLAADGRGGMSQASHELRWEVASDRRFTKVVARGRATARPQHGHAVHVEARGLRPGRQYWYRFRLGRHVSPTGRTRTAPARNDMPSSLTMAFASCAHWEQGYFSAYRRLADERPDLVVHLGDYQYEYAGAASGTVRTHEGPETTTLAGYRQRHAQYKTDPDLQAAHAAAPWLVTWDDHELDNNWADSIPENEAERPGFLARREAAFRAYYENMPLRRSSAPKGYDMQLYRRLQWGKLATFHMMDTRQYRSNQACGDGWDTDCTEAGSARRTITGTAQEAWLLDGFSRSRARWDLLGQQVFFAERDREQGPSKTVSMDGWDGYTASRQRITDGWIEAGVRNPVVLTGDVHTHWANELKADYDDPTGRSVGTELVTSSITSGGDGSDSAIGSYPWQAWNPHIKFQNALRGYVSTVITPDAMDVSFRCLPQVRERGAQAFTRARFVVEDRDPTLHLVEDNPIDVVRQSPARQVAETMALEDEL